MGNVVELDQSRKPDSPARPGRVWLAQDKDMKFHGVGGELVAMLRFEELDGCLYARLTTIEGFSFRRARCRQAIRFYELGLMVSVAAIERCAVTRLLLEFSPLGATP